MLPAIKSVLIVNVWRGSRSTSVSIVLKPGKAILIRCFPGVTSIPSLEAVIFVHVTHKIVIQENGGPVRLNLKFHQRARFRFGICESRVLVWIDVNVQDQPRLDHRFFGEIGVSRLPDNHVMLAGQKPEPVPPSQFADVAHILPVNPYARGLDRIVCRNELNLSHDVVLRVGGRKEAERAQHCG